MVRRLAPRRFQQARKAGLPVHRRSPRLGAAGPSSCVWVFTYDADGQCVSREVRPALQFPEPVGQVWSFTGHERNGETALFDSRVRHYDPSVGRWLSEEAIAFAADNPNLYRYVGNPPQDQSAEGDADISR